MARVFRMRTPLAWYTGTLDLSGDTVYGLPTRGAWKSCAKLESPIPRIGRSTAFSRIGCLAKTGLLQDLTHRCSLSRRQPFIPPLQKTSLDECAGLECRRRWKTGHYCASPRVLQSV